MSSGSLASSGSKGEGVAHFLRGEQAKSGGRKIGHRCVEMR